MPNQNIGDIPQGAGNVYSVDEQTGAVVLDGIRASLDGGGKVPESELPERAKSKIFTAASEVEQLALTVDEGDTCVRTDTDETYMAKNSTNASLADWQLLASSGGAVESVDGRVGVVTLDDLYEALVNKGVANGYASLDGSGKVPIAQIPGTPAPNFDFIVKSSGTQNLLAGDANKWLEFQNGASAADITFVAGATHGWDDGGWCYSSKTGSGEVEYKRGGGVVFLTQLGDVDFKIDSDGTDGVILSFQYRGSDTWYVQGPIKTV
jgi:hypothetical protein